MLKKNITDIHGKCIDLGDVQLIGLNCHFGGPEYLPKSKSYQDKSPYYKKFYKSQYNDAKKAFNKATKPVVFLTHNPPYGSTFSRIGVKTNPSFSKHVGSTVAREIIKTYKPRISISGHMHEYFDKATFYGKPLLCAGIGPKSYMILTTKNGNIQDIQIHKRD